jgi:hypothetical protein
VEVEVMDRRPFTRAVGAMRRPHRWPCLLILLALPLLGAGSPPAPTGRLELTHPPTGHEAHVSGAAVAAGRDGRPLLAWIAQHEHANTLFVGRPGTDAAPIRVNPAGTSVDSLHQPPGMATGPGGEVYVTWSASKPKPPGALFASDLYLSRSLDGGQTFDHHLRINDDRPTSHSFEDLAVAPDGTVLVSWIDTREGHGSTATHVARVTERGTRLESVTRLPGGETCVCCRVSLTAGPTATAVFWRKVFPGDVRDMVLSRSDDGGRSFAAAGLVHADGWKINACPHRGGRVAADGKGRLYAVWYTEAKADRPDVLFAVARDGKRFGAPQRVHTATGSVPDQARLAVNADGRGLVVWEDATAVRRRILLRTVDESGLGPVRVLSRAIKAWMPDVVVAPDGFLVVWHEERFPSTTTVVEHVRVPARR